MKNRTAWTDNVICHQCKEPMNYDLGVRVPMAGMPGTNWIVCRKKCAIALAESTGVEITLHGKPKKGTVKAAPPVTKDTVVIDDLSGAVTDMIEGMKDDG